MKRILILGLFLPFSLLAQEAWILPHRGKSFQKINNLESDKAGNIYTATAFGGNDTAFIHAKNTILNVIPEAPGYFYSNMLVSKYSPAGNLLWAVPITGEETVYSWSSHVAKDGSFYVGGNFKNDACFYSTDGDSVYLELQVPKDYPKQLLRFFLAKYDTDGVLQWVRTGHSWDNMACFDIVSDKEGNAYAWIYTPSNKVTIGDFSIYPSRDTKMYLERYHACLIKYSPEGEEQWITYTGGDITPRDIWLEDDQLVLAGAQSGNKEVIKSTSGKEWIIEGPPSHKLYEERAYRFDLKEGQLQSHEELFPDINMANLQGVRMNEAGYLACYEARYITGRGSTIKIKEDTIFSDTNPYGRDPDLYIVQFNKKRKYQWHVRMKGKTREEMHDMQSMPNGDHFITFRADRGSEIIDANNSKTLVDGEGFRSFHLIHLNAKGQMQGYMQLGKVKNNDLDRAAHLSSNARGDLNISTGMQFSTRVFGYNFEIEPRDKNFPHHGGNSSALLIHLPGESRHELIDLDITQKDLIVAATLVRQGAYRFVNRTKEIGRTIVAKSREVQDSIQAKVVQTRMEKSLSVNQVFLYPNPVSQTNPAFKINLDLALENKIILQLINGQSQIVWTQTLEPGKREASMEFPPGSKPGLYFLRVSSGKSMIIKKIVLN